MVKVEYIPGENRRIEAFINRKPRGLKTGFYLDEEGNLPENRCPCADSRERDLFCTHAVASALELIKLYSDPERLAKLEQEVRRAEKLEQLRRIDEFLFSAFQNPNRTSMRASISNSSMAGRTILLKEGKIPLACSYRVRGRLATHRRSCRWICLSTLKSPQENLLFVIEDICEGPATSRFRCRTCPTFRNILELLHGQHFSDGATERTDFRRERIRCPPYMRLDMDNETGELVFSVESPIYLWTLEDRLPLYFIARKKGLGLS